jgi:hypothetical protein
MIRYNLSILTFISCIITFILLLIRNKPNDIITAYVILYFGIIAYNDSIIWKSLENENTNMELNLRGSENMYYLMWGQIFFLGIGIAHEKKDFSVLILGLFILFHGHKNMKKSFMKTDVSLYSSNSLVYGFNEKASPLLFFLTIFLLFTYTNWKNTYLLLILLSVTYYHSIINNKLAELGNWVWIPGLLSIPLYILTTYLPNLN